MANLYELYLNTTSSAGGNGTGSITNASAEITYHRSLASDFQGAVLDLHWDPVKMWFYVSPLYCSSSCTCTPLVGRMVPDLLVDLFQDFNLTSNYRDTLYTPAGTFALWQNITPPVLQNNETAALQVVSGARYLLGRYGGIPAVSTLLFTGLNWVSFWII